jgi:hypothetical protein
MGGVIDSIAGTDLTGAKRDAKNALNGQQAATDSSNRLQRDMFNQGRKDQEPWRKYGTYAMDSLWKQVPELSRSFTMKDFQKDPGYDFRLQEANKALEASAAARGGLNSGRTLKDLTRYSQDYASNEYQNAYNRFTNDQDRKYNKFAGLANTGQVTAGQLANMGQQYGQQIGANNMGMANARASEAIGRQNANTQMTGSLIGAGGQALGGYLGGAAMFSDKNLKTNIEPISKEDLQELKDAIKPYKFNYTSDEYGAGDWIGVMAQDIEKTKLGKSIVQENEQGLKYLDGNKVMSLFLATMAEL